MQRNVTDLLVEMQNRVGLRGMQVHPVLAGAYKDLGDLLLMQYDSPRA